MKMCMSKMYLTSRMRLACKFFLNQLPKRFDVTTNTKVALDLEDLVYQFNQIKLRLTLKKQKKKSLQGQPLDMLFRISNKDLLT